jgi:hypothetical protein
LQALAAWNGIAAASMFYLGARLLSNPNKGILGTSAVLAVVVAGIQIYEIANGATHWSFLALTVAVLAAGVLSIVARPNAP